MDNFTKGISREGKSKVKKKMSKAQIQLALIKKKKCDARALMIVEKLLEPNISSQWLLQNLEHISQSHMEDVIEERAILKQCGYVLCNNPLTVIINQRYHISTKSNKVYDVSRRKNFCSSHCYGAMNYLLEQMLTSPLWLRDKEDIPQFHLLPLDQKSQRNMPGEEIVVGKIELSVDLENDAECSDNLVKTDREIRSSKRNLKETRERSVEVSDGGSIEIVRSNCEITSNCERTGEQLAKINENNIEIVENNETIFNEKCNETHKRLLEIGESSIATQRNIQRVEKVQEGMSSGEIDAEKISFCSDLKDDKECSNDSIMVNCEVTSKIKLEKSHERPAKTSVNSITMEKDVDYKRSKKITNKVEEKQKGFDRINDSLNVLVMRVEERFREWITVETFDLLLGETAVKQQALEAVERQDKYIVLCQKLNRLQFEDEKESRETMEKVKLKPLPHFSVLQEEGEKMELKVRAFFEGRTAIEVSEKLSEANRDNDEEPVLPLVDAYTPKAIRKRIFLNKLNKLLPDLLHALTGGKYLSTGQSINESDWSATTKALVNTFSLSATNIIFKTAEWTLVGLVIIKMLSIIEPRLKFLLTSKEASAYTSMILMSFKLEPSYLDRLIMSLTNIP